MNILRRCCTGSNHTSSLVSGFFPDIFKTSQDMHVTKKNIIIKRWHGKIQTSLKPKLCSKTHKGKANQICSHLQKNNISYPITTVTIQKNKCTEIVVVTCISYWKFLKYVFKACLPGFKQGNYKIFLHHTLQYSTVQYSTVQYTTLHYTTLHYTTLHYTTLHYTTLHYTTLHYTTLHYTTLHYTTLHYTTMYH